MRDSIDCPSWGKYKERLCPPTQSPCCPRDQNELDQGIGQDQLNATLVQLTAGSGRASAPPMTLKDELNVRIQERQRYLEVLNATFQLREAEIYLLRQTGQLDDWIQSGGRA